MNKIRKFLNSTLVIMGIGLILTSVYKADVTMSLIGLLVLDGSLSALSLDKNEEKIKTLEKKIEELKGGSNDTIQTK